jgi:hypothetical protein
LPARRETLVAPVPPEPVCLISSPARARTIRKPNGIEPSKYARMTINKKRTFRYSVDKYNFEIETTTTDGEII